MLILNDLDIDGKDFKVDTRSVLAAKGSNKIGSVRQRCELSSDLFLLYREIDMREVRDKEGIKVNGENINNNRYADDTALIADSESKQQAVA